MAALIAACTMMSVPSFTLLTAGTVVNHLPVADGVFKWFLNCFRARERERERETARERDRVAERER